MFVAVCILTSISCNESANSKVKDQRTEASERTGVPPGKPEEYFPTDIGRRFDYKIELTESDKAPAMNHEQVRWSRYRIETRGRYLLIGDIDRNDLHLIFKIKGVALKQGALEYPEGYELEIERDDIGVFKYCKNVFWAIHRGDSYQVLLVTEKDPNSPGAMMSGSGWGGYDAEPGHALRIAFFGEKPMISMGLSGENDSLIFVGRTEHKGRSALSFIRQVTANESESEEKKDSILDHGFEEQITFVRGVGMVQLTQVVENTVTMKWTLLE